MSDWEGGLPALYKQCVQWVCTDDVCVCLHVCLWSVSFSFKCCYLIKWYISYMKSIEEYENPQLFAINFHEFRLEIFPAKDCCHYVTWTSFSFSEKSNHLRYVERKRSYFDRVSLPIWFMKCVGVQDVKGFEIFILFVNTTSSLPVCSPSCC